MYMLGWGGATTDAIFTLQPVLHSRNDKGDGDYNWGNYKDAGLRRADRRRQGRHGSRSGARQTIIKAMKHHHDNVYHIPIHLQVIPWASRANVDGRPPRRQLAAGDVDHHQVVPASQQSSSRPPPSRWGPRRFAGPPRATTSRPTRTRRTRAPTTSSTTRSSSAWSRYDKKLGTIPSLATAWEQTSPRTWRFTLRKGVKFHDGTPVHRRRRGLSRSRARSCPPPTSGSSPRRWARRARSTRTRWRSRRRSPRPRASSGRTSTRCAS